jgi:hypothetical protein
MNDAAREKGRKNKQANDGIYEGGEPEELVPPRTGACANYFLEMEVDPDEEEVVDESRVRIRYK